MIYEDDTAEIWQAFASINDIFPGSWCQQNYFKKAHFQDQCY